MNAFDNEPSLGGGYEGGYPVRIDAGDEIPRRIAVRYRKNRGTFERVSVSLEEVRDAQTGTLVRFDDAHGRFHRHAPGWPQPSEPAEYLDHIPLRHRARYAIDETKARYTAWEAEIFGREGDEPQ